MLEYIPLGIFRSSFKFCMGDKLREKMEGEKGRKRFSVHFNLHKPVQIVFFKNCLPVLRPLSSVLYRIISKRRYILAAQLLLREKSGT
jgi:hypothetical protein